IFGRGAFGEVICTRGTGSECSRLESHLSDPSGGDSSIDPRRLDGEMDVSARCPAQASAYRGLALIFHILNACCARGAHMWCGTGMRLTCHWCGRTPQGGAFSRAAEPVDSMRQQAYIDGGGHQAI